MSLSDENEMTIVYFENEMEDTLNLDDHDTTTLRFINGKIYDGSNSEDGNGNGKRVCVTRQKTSHYWNIWSNIAANRISIASEWLKYADFVARAWMNIWMPMEILRCQSKKK
eukprot:467777_1